MRSRPPIVEDGVIAGNVTDKYHARNPLARRLMRGFLDAVERLAAQSGARDLHEVGCGEGFLAQALARGGRRVRGSDFSQQVIERARAEAARAGCPVTFRVAGIDALDPATDAAELIVCCEVLEHLPDPARALARLTQLARPHLLLSVPREPLWRALNLARGRYLGDLGNTPGHLQHWSRRGFLALVREHADIVRVEAPLPWTVVLARVRS